MTRKPYPFQDMGPENEPDERDASRELGIAMAIVFGLGALAFIVVKLIP